LISQTSRKVKFEWLSFHQHAFDKIKKVIGTKVLICYPDFNKHFHLYTDESDYQLEAVVIQNKRPIASYLRALNTAQKWYTTTGRSKELLSSIETCKKYKITLLDYHLPIVVFTDHKINTFNGLKASDRVSAGFCSLEKME
jgi:hypothetical protein